MAHTDLDIASLYQAVIDRPDDDEPRLAYADALGEDPRAKFIRAQMEVTRTWRAGKQLPAGSEAFRISEGYPNKYGDKWAEPVKPFTKKWRFYRGFVERVTMDAADFLKRAMQLYRRAPIRHLELTGVKAVARELFASPHLKRIVTLTLTNNNLGDDEVALLAASPHLGRLGWLELSRNQIGPAGLESLAASKNLPALKFLGFRANPAPDPTPSTGGVEWTGHVHDMNYPEEGKQLEAKYGKKAWLSFSVQNASDYPPDPGLF